MSFFKRTEVQEVGGGSATLEGDVGDITQLAYTWAAVRTDIDPSASYPYTIEVRTMDGKLMGTSIGDSPSGCAATAKRLAIIYKRNLTLPNELSGQGVV